MAANEADFSFMICFQFKVKISYLVNVNVCEVNVNFVATFSCLRRKPVFLQYLLGYGTENVSCPLKC